jgi:hypothetical protein
MFEKSHASGFARLASVDQSLGFMQFDDVFFKVPRLSV